MNRARQSRTTLLLLWGPVALYMAFIFAVSSMSAPPGLPSGLSDKGGHFLLFFGLGALLVRALAGGLGRRITIAIAALAVALSSLYGITDEIHQYFVPKRHMDALDVVADTIGAAGAATVLYVWARFREATRARIPLAEAKREG